MSRRKIFHRDAIRILDISRNRRISRAWRGSRRDVSRFRPRCITFRQMKKYCLGSFSTHEYHIHCNGLCTLQATSTPFPKLNYLSPVRFFFRYVSSLFHCNSRDSFVSYRILTLPHCEVLQISPMQSSSAAI